MKHLPHSTFHLLPSFVFLLWPWFAHAQSPEAAVSSQAVATQPPVPARLNVPTKPTNQTTKPPKASPTQAKLDPLLDLDRPKNCQLDISQEQTIRCAGVEVVLPAGTYQQVKVVEGPQERTAAASADLKPQAKGLGYIRYLAEVKIKVDGAERQGGIDIGVRPSDELPIRIWYKKFNPPDDVTKAISFILPPVMIVAGAGAWSSGNVLIPDQDPLFTEARDYYLKKVAAHAEPYQTEENLMNIKPAEAARGGSFYAPGSAPSALRSR
jgi:hypothetical protein